MRRLLALSLLLLATGCQYLPASMTQGTTASPSPTTEESARNASITWAFTQHHDSPDQLMIRDLALARARVDIAMYAFNKPEIATAIIDAQGRCQCVRFITDTTQAGGASQKAALTNLFNAGIPIKIDSHTGIMHMKVVQIDLRMVDEGSFNATNAASTVNDEILVHIASSEFANAVAVEFDAMWNDTGRFRNWQPTVATPTPVPAGESQF